MASLKADYPWTTAPLLVSAPMGGFAGGLLASSVTLAGGIGLIGSVDTPEYLERELQLAQDTIDKSKDTPDVSMRDTGVVQTLPIGVGIIVFLFDLPTILPTFTRILSKYRPKVIWLFAAHQLSDYANWTKALRSSLPYQPKIWIQTGSVSSALTLAHEAKPDVLVMQGIDAGGHGLERGASIVSLVPEALDALHAAGHDDISVLASGGIVDARGVAAALALGAAGVVMGTRFLSARETLMPHPSYRTAILKATDGGQSTTRAKVFDELRGNNPWPLIYDGRSLRNKSFEDWSEGHGIDMVRERFKSAFEDEAGEKGFLEGNQRASIWAGTGVGLVRKEQEAGEIVREVREGVQGILNQLKGNL